jgi:hypothetical protein
MRTNLLKSCLLAAAISLLNACSPDDQVAPELDKMSQSSDAMMCDIITFEHAVTRDGSGFVTSVASEGGAMIGVEGLRRKFPEGTGYHATNYANLFNTTGTDPGGSDDTDLMMAETGKVLIVNETDNAGVPDDYRYGAKITVDFSSLGSVTLSSLLWLDNESIGSHIILYGAGGVIKTIPVPSTSDGAVDLINLENTAGVVKLEAIFGSGTTGSGGIDNIQFCREVPSTGCTRTQGYWKNHASGSKKPDPAWAMLGPLGENTLFFNSIYTYYSILMVPVQGNGYFNLAHQYVAATLNMKTATAPQAVMDAYATATTLLMANSTNIAAVKNNKTLNEQFVTLAGILDAYNNGLTGPGHCD